MEKWKRSISMLLCVVMLMGILPVNAFAAEADETVSVGEGTKVVAGAVVDQDKKLGDAVAASDEQPIDAAIIFSDLHTSKSDYKESTVKGIMTAFKNTGLPFSSVTSGGDAFSSNETSYTGYTDTITGYIQKVLGDIPVNYVWSDHDRGAKNNGTANVSLDKNSHFVYGAGLDGVYGTDDDGNYYIYALSMADTSSWDRYNSGFYSASDIADHIDSFVEEAEGLKKDRPLLIVSHQPLFDRRGDNGYAYQWWEAIDAVATGKDMETGEVVREGMDVAFFFGHNHKYDVAADYYYAKGSKMQVATTKVLSGSGYSTDLEAKEVTLSFTHMCAGYLAPSSTGSTSGTTREGTAVAVTIYDDSITYTTYKASGVYTGNYALNETVTRDHAAAKVPASIAVSGDTRYAVGSALNLSVTVTYEDGTTAVVSDGVTFSGCDLTASGVYTVSAEYMGLIATIDVTVAVYAEDEYSLIGVEAVSEGVTGLTVTWDDAAEAVLDDAETFTDCVVYNLGLSNYTEGNQIEYSMTIVDDMDTANLALYHVAADGTLTAIPFGIVADCIVFKTTLTGAFAYGAQNVPQGYVLDNIAVTNVPKSNYFVGQSVDGDITVMATYKKDGAEDFVRQLYAYEESNNPDGFYVDLTSFDMTKAGKYNVRITYGEVSSTFPINVWDKNFAPVNGVSVSVSDDEFGVTGISVVDSTNKNVEKAISAFVVANTYKAYDIDLIFDLGYKQTQGVKTVTMPIPEGVTNPVVFYVPEQGAAKKLECTVNDDRTVTFTTTHFSTYALGESTEIEVPNPGTASGTGNVVTTTKKTVYVLTSSVSAGSYLIANSNTAGNGKFLLANNNGSVAATGVTIKSDGEIGTYIELDDAADELWTVTGSSDTTVKNGSYNLRWANNALSLSTRNSSSWTYSATNNRLTTGNRRLRYNNNAWTTSSNSGTVYFYAPTEIEVETTATVSGTYSIAATKPRIETVVVEGKTLTLGSTLTFKPNSGTATTTDTTTTATYEVVTQESNGTAIVNNIIKGIEGNVVTFNGNAGSALVKVSYDVNGDAEGGVVTNYIVVTAYPVADEDYTIDLTHGAPDYVSITAPLQVKNVKAGDKLSIWAVIKADGDDLGDLDDDALSWSVSNTEVATIDTHTGEITFTGEEGTVNVRVAFTCPGGRVITDTVTISAKKGNYVVPEDGTNDFPEYPQKGSIRFDKTASAVGNFSETGITELELSMTGIPFSNETKLDVALILDHSNSMTEDRRNATIAATKKFIEMLAKEGDQFTGNRIFVADFSGGNPAYRNDSKHTYQSQVFTNNESNPGAQYGYQIINSDNELNALLQSVTEGFDNATGRYGTDYDNALKDCYNVLSLSQSDGNQQFCVFMSDGIPNTYQGETNYYDGTTTSRSNNYTPERGLVDMFVVNNYNQASATATRDTDYEYEYYSTQMKNNGVSVFSVGLGLDGTNSAWGNASKEACLHVGEMLLNDISGPANEKTSARDTGSAVSKKGDYFFSVNDAAGAAGLTNVFEKIAEKITQAARDVRVTDKIADEFTMVFDVPNTVVGEATPKDQEFYIEIKDYALNPVKDTNGNIIDFTRGASESLIKLYMGKNADGSYYAAKDASGTAFAAPTFSTDPVGTRRYWTTNASQGDCDVSVVGADGVTYYFISSGKGTHNMTANAYAYGTPTSEWVYTTATDTKEGAGPFFKKNADGTYTQVDKTEFEEGHVYFTRKQSTTYKNLIIATPHFVYNAESRILVWTTEKLADHELAMTYFLYLDHSGGYEGSELQTDPETFKTNEYAYLNYTNHLDVECQQEFPKPQVTWNGAQVSYVFYLVNEQGQPVNRAGKVVPFSEAVYVTDVFTYAIVWNRLEQAAGLDAARLAEDLVPDVYKLYDKGAAYSIHVYEDEEESNLNNHFVIESAPENGRSNKTTYVFNTKADEYKYNVPGTYMANAVSGNTYLCKSYNVDAEYTKVGEDQFGLPIYNFTKADYTATEGEVQWKPGEGDSYTGGTKVGDYVYYVDENGDVYTIVQKTTTNKTHAGFDYANTTVAFAVVWSPALVPDVVVIDFGLDVVVDVTTNDAVASGVVGVRQEQPMRDGSIVEINRGQYTADKAQEIDVYIDANGDSDDGKELMVGKATVESQKSVRFSLDKTNGMQMSDPAVFYYESDLNFYEGDNLITTSMYSSVTVIPATTIYYEDEYVTLKTFTREAAGSTNYTWKPGWEVNSVSEGEVQAQDRPGESKLSISLDADNVYGFDKAYEKSSTYSLGDAAMTQVTPTKFATAEFDFYGTGFDIVSVTSNMTGTITVQVLKPDGTAAGKYVVDTYYGYVYGLYTVTYTYTNGKWVRTVGNAATAEQDYEFPKNPTEGMTVTGAEMTWKPVDGVPEDLETTGTLYQVPVIKVAGLDYGKYHVKITADYNILFDHDQYAEQKYDFYLDAIRIYDPAGKTSDQIDDVTEGAYNKDHELFPEYHEVRNLILKKETFDAADSDKVNGIVFIDSNFQNTSISDYTNFGPNNEVYLANGQAVAFTLNATRKDGYAPKVEIAWKSVGGNAKVKVGYINNGEVVPAFEQDITTATDLYYDITALNGKTLVVESVGEDILSITNVKFSYQIVPTSSGSSSGGSSSSGSETVAAEVPAPFTVNKADVEIILEYLNTQAEEEIIPETTVPEETTPETTVPEETEPEKPDPETVKKELQDAVAAAKNLKENDYTKESFEVLKSARKDAEKVLKDKKATQAEMEAALDALNAAMEALEAKPEKEEPAKPGKPDKEEKPGKPEKAKKPIKAPKAEKNDKVGKNYVK